MMEDILSRTLRRIERHRATFERFVFESFRTDDRRHEYRK